MQICGALQKHEKDVALTISNAVCRFQAGLTLSLPRLLCAHGFQV